MRASFHVDDEPQTTIAIAGAAAELATAHGLVEAGGWCDYLRAEACLADGDWDAALAAGLRAVDLGEAHDFHRVVVRSWFALLPIAAARRRSDLLQRAFARFDARRGCEPDSPYARVITTAAHLRLAAAGLEPLEVPDVESRLPSFDLSHGGPSWLLAACTLVEAWLSSGDDTAAERALDTMRARLARGSSSRLALATEALLRARLLLAREDAAGARRQAERSLELTTAPWWRLGAIGVLEATAGAPPELAAEAVTIAQRLGVPVPKTG